MTSWRILQASLLTLRSVDLKCRIRNISFSFKRWVKSIFCAVMSEAGRLSLSLSPAGAWGSPQPVSVSQTRNRRVRPEADRCVLQGLQVSPVRSSVPLILSAHADNRIFNCVFCVFWTSPPFMFSVLEGGRLKKRERERKATSSHLKKKKNQSHWSMWKTKGPNPFHYPPLWLKLKCSLKKKMSFQIARKQNLFLSASPTFFASFSLSLF